MAIKQIEYEKRQLLISEAERALELMGRAIRMAGYRNIHSEKVSIQIQNAKTKESSSLEINKKTGFRGSDSFTVRHELSDGIDFDCIGNTITKERTKNHLAFQGFIVDRQAGVPKGTKVNGGSLICQSLDRQGRIQNTTLMNGVNGLSVEELDVPRAQSLNGQKLFRVKIQMTDGAKLNLDFERLFSTRNLI